MTSKREEYISWDAYFLGLAAMASFRSKDPSTQNGACIIDPESLSPLALGYNGFPRCCSDDEFPWAREAENKNDTKYPYVEHAERNAVYNAARKGISLEGSTIYIHSEKGYYPCDECARAIIQSGIKRVVMGWAINSETDKYSWDATLKMFRAAGVEVHIICSAICSAEVLRSHNCSTGTPKKASRAVSDMGLIANKMREIQKQLERENGHG